MQVKSRKIGITLVFIILILGGYIYRNNQSATEKKNKSVADNSVLTKKNNQKEDANSGDEYIEPMYIPLHFSSMLDSNRMIATISWDAVEHASKYVIDSYLRKDGEWKKKEEKTIDAEDKNIYQHSFSYGEKYKYEMTVYQNVAGEDLLLSKFGSGEELFYVDCKAPQVDWSDENLYSSTKKEKKESIKLIFGYMENCLTPTGFEIYRGESKKQMTLLDAIDIREDTGLQIYSDKTAEDGLNYFYKIRSYVIIDGKRKYGKKSEIRELSTDDSWGVCKTKLIVQPQNKIADIEVILTSKDNQIMYFGKKYIDRNAVVFCFDNDISYTDFSLKLNEISYKYRKSDQYQELSYEDIISIKPEEKLYIRFARKNHKKFDNPIQIDGNLESNNVSIYGFYYKEHMSFLYFESKDNVTRFNRNATAYIKWRKADERTYID